MANHLIVLLEHIFGRVWWAFSTKTTTTIELNLKFIVILFASVEQRFDENPNAKSHFGVKTNTLYVPSRPWGILTSALF